MPLQSMTPQLIDQRSLELHQLIAAKLREHSERLEGVRQTLARWKIIVAPNSQPYIAEWQRLVDAGLEATLAVALEDSEHAATLRSYSPFGSVLSPKERFAFYEQWIKDHTID